MRGQRPLLIATRYPDSGTDIEGSPMAIDSTVQNSRKTFSINKSFGVITKLLALLLFVTNPLIVTTADTTADTTVTAPSFRSAINLSSPQRYSCPGECSCKPNEDHFITTDCTKANLTALPNNISPNTTSLILNQNRITNVTEDEFSGFNHLKRLWINDNLLDEVPTHIFKILPKLEALSIANNRIKTISDFAFKPLIHLAILDLQNNRIQDIKPLAFDGLKLLKILEINGNSLKSLPNALSKLNALRELTLANNQIEYLAEDSFKNNSFLTILEIKGNPLEEVANNAFINLPFLKKLTLSEVSKLKVLPNFSGTTTLEHLKIDRGQLRSIPPSLCEQTPRLKSLIVKSNKINSLPKLSGCPELKLLDFSYNHIKTFGNDPNFINQTKLIDLFMGHNLIADIPQNAFKGLSSLKVLNLVRNRITTIHTKAFVPLFSLKDLNLGDNRFSTLPTEGLQNLTEIKVYGNPNLKEFPPIETFPRVHTLALSYAYHCCAYIGRTHTPTTNPKSLEESIVWLDKEDAWNTNMTDVWPGYVNFSTKFEEFANQLWKNFGRDYVIPDNIAEYAEQYFEDYKPNPNADDLYNSFPIQCLPQPGPFMPCKDLFDWWTLRCGVWIVFLLALLGNGVVVVVLIFGRSKIDVPRFLVCNLAIADFFMGVYLGVLAIVDASTLGEFKVYAIRWQTSWGCQVAGFFGVFSSELSVYTLAVITMERNYAITHAMHLNKRLSLRHASYIMSIGWTFAICMAVLPLVGISDYRKFAVCLPFEVEDSIWSLTYVVFLILINGVAFLVLMGCYLRMYCAIRGSQAWNSNDSRIAKRMALLVFTDFLCWAPIAFFSLTAVSGLHLISLEEAKVFTIFVLPLNSCANPFLYAIFTKQFKKECVLLCKRIEESRVTRGIGRCRHSSNFSNRHTPAVSNSAIERKSTGSDHLPQLVCQCGIRKPKVSIEEVRLITALKPSFSWKQRAIDWFNFSKRNDLQKSNTDNSNQNFQNQKNIERMVGRAASISSDNFSSRSDSWRNPNIPLKNIEKSNRKTNRQTNPQAIRGRRNSWNASRKTSQDSSQVSYSRQDSNSTSTYTSRISRSSFSSESSSRPTTSSSSSGAGPSGLQKHELIKSQLNRQTAIDESKLQKSPPNRLENSYLCHNCANRKDGTQPQTLSPKKFKNKELEEKFNCFYNRLAEASQEDSSEGAEPLIVSSESNKLDSSTQSRDTAETSLQDSTTSQETEAKRYKTQPSIEIAPLTPMTDKSFDDFDGLMASRTSSSHSGQTAIHYSGETLKDPNRLDISPDNITKTHSMTDFGSTEKIRLKTRKVSSENSLKKLSIRNLPSLLKSLSGHSNMKSTKKHKAFNSKKSRPYYRSADNMICLTSNSCEAINHQLSDSVLNKRRSTAFELYQTNRDLDCSDCDDIEDKKLIREEKTELMSDITISDRRDSVSEEKIEPKVYGNNGQTTNEDMLLIGVHVSKNDFK